MKLEQLMKPKVTYVMEIEIEKTLKQKDHVVRVCLGTGPAPGCLSPLGKMLGISPLRTSTTILQEAS
jgi:hypothetical protein